MLATDTEAAFGEIKAELDSSSERFNDCIHLFGRFNDANRDFQQGIIRREDYNLELAQVRAAMIDLIDEITIDDLADTAILASPATPEKTAMPAGEGMPPRPDTGPDATLAHVLIFRPDRWDSQLRKIGIYVNQEKVGVIKNEGQLPLSLPPGKHVLTAKMDFYRSAPLELVLRPGEVKNLELHLDFSVRAVFNPGKYLRFVEK